MMMVGHRGTWSLGVAVGVATVAVAVAAAAGVGAGGVGLVGLMRIELWGCRGMLRWMRRGMRVR